MSTRCRMRSSPIDSDHPAGPANAGFLIFMLGGYGQSLGNLFQKRFSHLARWGERSTCRSSTARPKLNLGRALAEGKQIDVQRERHRTGDSRSKSVMRCKPSKPPNAASKPPGIRAKTPNCNPRANSGNSTPGNPPTFRAGPAECIGFGAWSRTESADRLHQSRRRASARDVHHADEQ